MSEPEEEDVERGMRAFEAGGQEWADWNASMLNFDDDEPEDTTMSAYFEVGPSGRGPCVTCQTEEQLLQLAPHLPPGKYWITRTDLGESVDGVKWRESEDWGVLEVKSPEDWHLESLAGLEAGPGYLLA